jgi:hypothetical protein
MKQRVVRYSGELVETQREGYEADQHGESLRRTRIHSIREGVCAIEDE